jgi:hypothetical protein
MECREADRVECGAGHEDDLRLHRLLLDQRLSAQETTWALHSEPEEMVEVITALVVVLIIVVKISL